MRGQYSGPLYITVLGTKPNVTVTLEGKEGTQSRKNNHSLQEHKAWHRTNLLHILFHLCSCQFCSSEDYQKTERFSDLPKVTQLLSCSQLEVKFSLLPPNLVPFSLCTTDRAFSDPQSLRVWPSGSVHSQMPGSQNSTFPLQQNKPHHLHSLTSLP